MPIVLALLLDMDMSAKYSCDPDICSAEPTPVTQRQASSCVKFRDIPQPIIPAAPATLSQICNAWARCFCMPGLCHNLTLLDTMSLPHTIGHPKNSAGSFCCHSKKAIPQAHIEHPFISSLHSQLGQFVHIKSNLQESRRVLVRTKCSDERSPYKQGLAAIAVCKDARGKIHHQAADGIYRDCGANSSCTHTKALHSITTFKCWPMP